MTLLTYTFRRYDGLVELLIPQHDWAIVVVRDGTADTGDYLVTVDGVTFSVSDTAAGVDDSAALVTALIAAVNASSVPVTAFAGPDATSFRLRHDQFGRKLNLSVSTTDPDGAIRYRPDPPSGFDLQFADNWDAAFSSEQVFARHRGFVSATPGRDRERLDALTVNANQFRDYTRCIFDLADFGRLDNVVNFVQVVPQFAGAPFVGVVPATNILLTEKQLLESHTMLTLVGTAPLGASIDGAQVLELPRQISSYTITNRDGTNDLLVSFGVGTQELTVGPGETIRDNRVNISTLTVRGDVAAVPVDITVTLNAQRML